MAPLTFQAREAIESDLRSGTASVRSIANEHGVAASTVSRIGKAAEIDRESADAGPAEGEVLPAPGSGLSARRSALAADTLAMAEKVLASFQNVDWDRVAPDKRAVVFGILTDKAAALSRNEAEGLAAVDAYLRSVIGG